MGKLYNSVTELVGRTPLLRLHNYAREIGVTATLAVKLESFNPAGSAKDRIALQMIKDAEADGRLKPGALLIEPTSGNTGIGLASIAAARGYKALFVMPETMSIERRKLLRGYGAEIYLTEGKKGMAGAIAKAKELAQNYPGSMLMGQFDNLSNPRAHYLTTGPEIWEDTDGEVDIFVAGVGTGGTITGVGEYLKKRNLGIQVIAVEPSGSPVLSGGNPGPHGLQGIGAGFVPEVLNTAIYNEVVRVTDGDAILAAKRLAQTEGILAGISSGAALFAAGEVAKRPENAHRLIVALLPDTGERYLSTELFAD